MYGPPPYCKPKNSIEIPYAALPREPLPSSGCTRSARRAVRLRLHPDGPLWTFWDYKFERWPKDKGMRLDHFLLSPKVADRLVDGGVDRWARGQVNASDHAPTWIMLDH